jgi:hypothetical protein
MTMLTDELIDALRQVPAKDAQAIVAEARKNYRQQRMERGAAVPLWHVGHKPATDPDTKE